METGELIRATRIERCLTQKELGNLCGMADSAIRRYESGRGNPTQKTLQRIANALGVPVSSLIDALNSSYENAIKTVLDCDEVTIRVLKNWLQLNSLGRQKLEAYIDDLLKIPEYRVVKNQRMRPANN